MPGVHAYLSPSSAKRWMECTPSVKLEQNFPHPPSSEFAKEGTKAHDIAEQKLTKWLHRGRKKILCEDKEMDEYTDQYRDYVIEIYNKVKKTCKDPILMVEQKLDLAEWTVDGFGTGDAIIIGDDTLHIIDLKYGKGVPVSANNNPQLRLYALGAIKEYMTLYDFNKVDMHIMQPRLDSVSDEVMSLTELISWGDDYIKPRAEKAYKGEGDYVPGEHCQFCRAKAACKARANYFLQLKKYGFMDADLLNNKEISEILSRLDELTKWATDIKAFALDQMLKGVKYNGFKVVEGRSMRKVTDEDLLVGNMTDAGIEKALLYEKKLLALTKLEKLAGKKEFAIISAGCVEKPAGAPAIAPESDKRPEYNTGISDFAEELAV